jgi:hypothetical protein
MYKLLQNLSTGLEFKEPHLAPSKIAEAFFIHIAKEGVNINNLCSLIDYSSSVLEVAYGEYKNTDWPMEIQVIMLNSCNGLLDILTRLYYDCGNTQLKEKLLNLSQQIRDYMKLSNLIPIAQKGFSAIYSRLEAVSGDIGRRDIYRKILTDIYDYKEAPNEIVYKATKRLDEKLSRMNTVTEELARNYGVNPDTASVTAALSKKGSCEYKSQLIITTSLIRLLKPLILNNLVRIANRHRTIVMEPPSLLKTHIPVAAIVSFNGLTQNPFNKFFIVDSGQKPLPLPALLLTVIHEEFGHGVNMSNSALGFGYSPPTISKLASSFVLPVTEAIAVSIENEFVTFLNDLSKKNYSQLNEKELYFIKWLEKNGEIDTTLLEIEFIMLQWEVMRLLGAIADVKINLGELSFYEFIEWAAKKTGFSKQTIFRTRLRVLQLPGYAPCYSICSESLRHIKGQALANNRSLIDVNTIASSLGWPARSIFEEHLKIAIT